VSRRRSEEAPAAPEEGRAGPEPTSALRDDLAALRLSETDKDGARRGGRRRRRWLLAGAVAAVLVAAAAARMLLSSPLRVETAPAEPFAEARREPIPVLSGTGYLVPAQPTIAVGSRVAGRIERYLVDEGDRVVEGDPLVVLEASPFQATADQVRASLASARARRALAETEAARARDLAARGVLAQEELDRRTSEVRVARAAVAELEAALSRAEIDLEDAVVRAPTSGVVLETFKQPGEVAVPGGFTGSGDLLRLANLSELRAELDVNEADLPRVALGQHADVTPDAWPDRTYAGRVVQLAPQIDRQKGTRVVEVRVLEPDEHLLPDMSVRVVFYAELGEGEGDAAASQGAAAVIPRAALRRDDGGRPYVWVVNDGRARRVEVEPGDTIGERVVVRSGLAGGESLVVGPAPERDGARVVVE
jgi:RND family efflux transporter MFP subunit